MTRTQAIEHFKGIPKLAKALGISYAAVAQWGEIVPKLRQHELEKLTGGILKVDSDSGPKAA
ncbi:Cro/Cl family transcriptional regulator [Pseudomonas sp. RC4D1]|uniref:Cro/CI family transcriptional regulator n=1 Tax=Pseudomonas sp. RC4D1 TaxID=2834407 RepID=UPI001BCD8C84|nr:Cro/CI family transcriptional regulator [Pseudomonas sp. RC4D1]MBS7559955.1 Cro/Cl family transcriptional regulator [Pseudomonas sp. RC4D1]